MLASLPFGATHCGHLGAIASVAAFRDGEPWLDAVLAVLDHNRALLAELLAARLPGGRLPAAARRLPRLARPARSSASARTRPQPLLERGRIALNPGPAFGPPGAGFARLNFGTAPSLVEEAVDRIAKAVDRG